jgi:cytochrome P450
MPLSHPRATKAVLPATTPFPALIQTAACRARPLEYLEWCRRQLGPTFTIRALDMPPLVFLSDPDDIRALVAAPLNVLHPGRGAVVTEPLFGARSFILLEEDERIRGRQAIMPAFHRHRVAAHSAMITEMVRASVTSWPLDAPVALHPFLRVLTLTAMLRMVCGGDGAAADELKEPLLSMLSVTASLVLQAPRLRSLPGWRRIWSQFIRDRERVDELIWGLVARRRGRAGDGRGDMLDMLLDARRLDGSLMTASELRDNVVAVIVAGHETTAAALAWAMQLLAHHPKIQERLAAEADAGESEDYLHATVNEVLRHRPVFLFSAPRAVVDPVEIGGWTYAPPAHLLGCIYLMHHNPALFPNPQAFRPERFLASRAPARTWLPWGGGQQRCPGRHLALLQLRTVLRVVVSTFRVESAGRRIERACWRSVIVTPHGGSTVVLRKRHSSLTHTGRCIVLSSKSSARDAQIQH